MGILYEANCPCGFKQIDLLQGSGIQLRETRYELYQCEQCHNLASYELNQEADSLFKPVRCRECHATMIRLSGALENRHYCCPECHKADLQLRIVTLWD